MIKFRLHKMLSRCDVLDFSGSRQSHEPPLLPRWRSQARTPESQEVRNGSSAAEVTADLTRIVVKKSARRLLLYSGKELCQLSRRSGLSPNGDKATRRHSAHRPKYSTSSPRIQERFLSVARFDYPNAAHTKRGLRDGCDHKSASTNEILRALQAKAAAASEHGARRRYLHPRQWRAERLDLGLVALEDEDIRELFDIVKLA